MTCQVCPFKGAAAAPAPVDLIIIPAELRGGGMRWGGILAWFPRKQNLRGRLHMNVLWRCKAGDATARAEGKEEGVYAVVHY